MFALLSLLLACAPALASENPKNIGAYKGWTVWKYSQKARSRCFIYANPSKATPKGLDHGLVSFFVRSTSRAEVKSEASLQVGYRFKAGQEVSVVVDGETFRMITEDKGAWLAKGGARERDLVEAMKGGKTMTVSARSRRGNATSYVFALAGVTDALKKMRTVCP